MKFKSLVSPLAVAAALSFGTAAYAQTFVGGQEISDADLPIVEAHCATLAGQGDEVAPDPELDAEAPAVEDDPLGEDPLAEDPLEDDAAADDGLDGDGALDLDAITLEDCQEAGLVE